MLPGGIFPPGYRREHLSIATELSTNNALTFQRRNRFENFDLLIPDRLAIGSGRRLHGQVSQYLKQMILNHIADRANSIIESPPALDSEVFGHSDLHALDMVAIPKRFQDCVGKSEEYQVVHRPLAKVMVDAEDSILIESAEQN